jgi:hypothetical protein
VDSGGFAAAGAGVPSGDAWVTVGERVRMRNPRGSILAGVRTAHLRPPSILPMSANRPALLLRDLRNPAAPMRPLTLKLPGQMIEALGRHAKATTLSEENQ